MDQDSKNALLFFAGWLLLCFVLSEAGSFFGRGYHGSEEYLYINSEHNTVPLPDIDFTTP